MLVLDTPDLITMIDSGAPVRCLDEQFAHCRLEVLTSPDDLLPGLLIGVYNAQAKPPNSFRVYRVAREPLVQNKHGNISAILLPSWEPERLPGEVTVFEMGLTYNKRGERCKHGRTFRLIEA